MKALLMIAMLLVTLINANEPNCNGFLGKIKGLSDNEQEKVYKNFCNKNCGRACYLMSYNQKDEKKKLELKKKGCEAGYTMGCDFLANDFADEKNYGLALKYYKVGCDLGDDQSCGTLGMIYATGKYGEKNPEKAYRYWTKSVKINPNNAQSKGNLKILCRHHPSVCK